MKTYVLKDLNDPSKYKIEHHSHAPSEHFGQPPLDNNGDYHTDASIFVVKDMWMDYTDPQNPVEKDAAVDAPGVNTTYKKTFVDSTKEASRVSELIQKGRDAKLAVLRVQIEIKMKRADDCVKMHEDTDTSSPGAVADWRTHRKALRNTTNTYKTGTTGNAKFTGASALDAFADDMSDFTGWPTEPV